MNEKYRGMMVNERLFESGLIKDFDEAVVKKDTAKVVSILKEVDLYGENIEAILKHFNLTE